MKKILISLSALAIGVSTGMAAMDDVSFTVNPGTAKAATNTFVMRGFLEGVEISTVAPVTTCTNAVVITYADQTMFSKSTTGDVSNAISAAPMRVMDNYAGADLIYETTAGTTNTVYGKWAVAGTVKVVQTFTGTSNNTFTVKLVYSK
jgi:hypothetical protein